MMSKKQTEIYVEVSRKRAMASALEWPGWCRFARDEQAALQALLDYGPRYERALRGTSLGFKAPLSVSDLKVIERLPGSASTEYGVPDRPPGRDSDPVKEADLVAFEELLRACWRAFDAAAKAATGKVLRTGPRGGGRSLEKMRLHVLESDEAYLGMLGSKSRSDPAAGIGKRLKQHRAAVFSSLRASAAGEYPALGPRGGKRWPPRYFLRRVAWHALDHAWEIEDRISRTPRLG
jgi:hypothetical protein